MAWIKAIAVTAVVLVMFVAANIIAALISVVYGKDVTENIAVAATIAVIVIVLRYTMFARKPKS